MITKGCLNYKERLNWEKIKNPQKEGIEEKKKSRFA